MDDLNGKYIIEFYQVGNNIKVSAIDPITQTETCIVGPSNVSKDQLCVNAIRKLEYVLSKSNRQ